MVDADPVEAFIRGCDAQVQPVLRELRKLIRRVAPEATEKLQPGWKVIQYMPAGGSMRARCGCAIGPKRGYVNLYFPGGVDLPDPQGLLEGTGKSMRHVKLRPGRRLPSRAIAALVRASMRSPNAGG